MMAFGMVDKDQDGLISLEEGHAIADEPLMMMEAQGAFIMDDSIVESELPPPMLMIRQYMKCMREIIPTYKAALADSLADGISKEVFVEKMSAAGEKLVDAGVMTELVKMSADNGMVPPPVVGLLTPALEDLTPDFKAMMPEVMGICFDFIAKDGLVKEAELDALLTAFLPLPAAEKFDKVWAMLDTDGDGKITQDEVRAFVGKFFDFVVGYAKWTIKLYRLVLEKIAVSLLTMVIEMKSADGMTLEDVMGLVHEGPEFFMQIMAAKQE